MALKILLPALNIPELIRRHPKVLRYEVGLHSCEHGEASSKRTELSRCSMCRNGAATKPSCSCCWVLLMTGDTILNALIDSSQYCVEASACLQNGVSAVKKAVRDMTAMMPAYHVQVNALRAAARSAAVQYMSVPSFSRQVASKARAAMQTHIRLSVQERLLDEDGQMWMSFKERLMYWDRETQSQAHKS